MLFALNDADTLFLSLNKRASEISRQLARLTGLRSWMSFRGSLNLLLAHCDLLHSRDFRIMFDPSLSTRRNVPIAAYGTYRLG